ncbi:Gfo/Idh/MocA family protein [Butyrivibrio sp. INlla14]|uniref:Gfo/Idh/MocA family protein n=1 Tax=Butyrivibrio sp. INlla14 TaxID=1520808 RepID=UPI00087709C5|nr:Gfo/Idh/MocA family oxidoreductase [Butyrivibrio sp. INlla14]SCY15405.1 Predicted dehydrogenase [Butyrivibrio sp. INlla14]
MAKIKWGVLGTANIARGCTIPGMKLAEDCELYAIAGRSLEKAESFKQEFGFQKAYGSYEELIADKDVQAVYIPLPNNLHLKWVKEALSAGKHVICEKPLALNADEAKLMFDTAKENGVYLMEAYAYLHSPYVESLKKDIADGVIGDVDYIETAFVTQGYKEDIRLHKDLGGGAMYDLGCYCTTMILSLIDSEPEYVKASAEFTDLGVDAMTSGIIRFENSVRAAFNVGMVLGKNTNARYDRLYIHGSKGSIRSEVEYNQQGDAGYRVYTADGLVERKVSIPQNYSLEIVQMCRCINGNGTPHVTPEFSIKNAQLMDRVLKEIGY